MGEVKEQCVSTTKELEAAALEERGVDVRRARKRKPNDKVHWAAVGRVSVERYMYYV
jgi:hypothetical protein